MFCQVIVDIVHENVAKPFTYQIPDGMELTAGQRVAVPFGHMEKEGIVTALTPETDVSPAKIRSVIRPLEEYAAIPPELMGLAEDMARKSHCPLAETLRLMIPAQMRGGRVHIKTEKTVCLRVNREEAEAAAAACTRSMKRNAILNLLMDGQPGKAVAAVKGDDAESDYLRAVAAARQGSVDEAKKWIQSAVTKDPSLAQKVKKDIEFAKLGL